MNNFNLDANINHDFKPIHANRFRSNQINENVRQVWWLGTRVGENLGKTEEKRNISDMNQTEIF